MKKIALIAALGTNRAIGRDNKLLWKLPGDLPRFKALTMGKPVIMGRKTFESIGKPLPGRTNIVLSMTLSTLPDGILLARDMKAAFSLAYQAEGEEIMVIGGGEIYNKAIDLADTLYLTEVDNAPVADAFFPQVDKDVWTEVSRQPVEHAPRFSYVTYLRKPAV